jgi:hypothetical protein
MKKFRENSMVFYKSEFVCLENKLDITICISSRPKIFIGKDS